MNQKKRPGPDRLVERVDALLRSQRPAPRPADAEVPVLTEIVDAGATPPPAQIPTRDALEALARELERSVLERLGGEIDRVIEERLTVLLASALEQSLGYLRAELGTGVKEMMRAAIAAAVARALAARFPGGSSTPGSVPRPR